MRKLSQAERFVLVTIAGWCTGAKVKDEYITGITGYSLEVVQRAIRRLVIDGFMETDPDYEGAWKVNFRLLDNDPAFRTGEAK